MWPFTRKTDASNVDGPPAPAVPQIRFDWKSVAPIQRLIADHPLTVPTESFATELATHQDPRAVAEPLGHQVSLEAPRGLVLGIAQPQTRADGPEMPTRPRPSRRFPLQRSLEEPAEATTPIESTDIEAPLVTSGGPLGGTMRQLPVSSTAPLQRASLTTVGPESEPLPLAPTKDIVLAGSLPDGESEATEPAASLPPSPRLTVGQARRMGLGAPLSRVPDTSVQRAVERAAPPPSLSSPTPATPVAEELPYDPIFPLDFPTPKPVVAPAPISRPQRIPTAMPLARPSVSSDAPPSSEAAAEATSTQPQPTVEPAVVAPLLGAAPIAVSGDPPYTMLEEPAKGELEGTDEAPLPPLRLAGTSARAAGPGESEAPLDFAREAPADAPAAGRVSSPVAESNGSGSPKAGEADIIAPLLSERPLVATAVQRAPEGVPSPMGGPSTPAVPGGLGGVRVYRGGEASMKATAIGARAFTERGDIYLPAAHGPLNDMPARSLLAHELVHAGQQRRFGGALPAEHSDDGQRMEAEAQTVERSVATEAEMPLARVAASPMQASTAVIEARAPWATSATIQRAPESNGSSPPAASEPPSMSSAGQPAPGASLSPQKADDTQMDELAAKLYDKIRNRLRNELLVDRERAGFLTDLR
jgi:Domain of unknown function (DUF4157)